MLDSVVIILSLITALTCLTVYVVRNRDLRDYVSGRTSTEEGFLDDCSTDSECR